MNNKLVCLLGFLITFSSWAKVEVTRGSIFEKGSDEKKLLFKSVRTQLSPDKNRRVVLNFLDPKGTTVITQDIKYENDRFKTFKMDKRQRGESALVERKKDKVYFYYKDPDGKEHKEVEDLEPNTMMSDELHPFMVKNWDKLAKGDTLKIRYIVPHRTETVGFKLFKDGETNYKGKPCLIIKMKPSSFFIAALVDPIYFTLGKETGHPLHRYVGRTYLYRKVNNKWKPLDAETTYQAPELKEKAS